MSMADRDGVIWLDGEMVPWRDATALRFSDWKSTRRVC